MACYQKLSESANQCTFPRSAQMGVAEGTDELPGV
jgi:hypothetical protein